MSDTAITPGVGAIVATGNAPLNAFRILVDQGSIVATGNAPQSNSLVRPGVGAIGITGLPPTNAGMWALIAASSTTWTALP